MKTNLRIGEVLIEKGCVTPQQMEDALAYQKEHRDKRVGQILMELGFVTESQVLDALAGRLGLEIVRVPELTVDLEAVAMVDKSPGREESASADPCEERRYAACDERSAELFCAGRGASADKLLPEHRIK